MSYSFAVSARTKAEAIAHVAAQFDRIVESQAVHEADRDAAQAAVTAFIEVLAEPNEREGIAVSVSGYLSWREEGVFTTSNLSVSAHVSAALPA